MSKVSKKRFCPGVQREISARECGEGRNNTITCPESCSFNPMARENYDCFLELEAEVDKISTQRLFKISPKRTEIIREFERALINDDVAGSNGLMVWNLFYEPAFEGKTFAEKWQAEGYPDLTNDMAAILRGKMQVRVCLLEVRRILNGDEIEVIDLMRPEMGLVVVRDRTTANRACRFTTLLAWAYPMPGFWRLSTGGTIVPDMAQFEPLEILDEIIQHLGGNRDGERPVWLAQNLKAVMESLTATSYARREAMLLSVDLKGGKVVYQLKKPYFECRSVLDACPDVSPEKLQEGERNEGFSEARVWFAKGGTRGSVLGTILLGQSFWRLESFAGGNLRQLRKQFEELLGDRVEFQGEKVEDHGRRMVEKEPGFNRALVPPRLLEDPAQIAISTSRVPMPEGGLATIFEQHNQTFLDETVPALEGLTPREAAAHPAMRKKLIRLMKSRIRSVDERNLEDGGSYDINWMIRDLGLTEILLEPPPKRTPHSIRGSGRAAEDELGEETAEDEAERLPAPLLPVEPLREEEIRRRFKALGRWLETSTEGFDELELSGATILDDVEEIMGDVVNEAEFHFLLSFIPQVWFVLVPPGSVAPYLSFDLVSDRFQQELRRVGTLSSTRDKPVDDFLSGCSQPALFRIISNTMTAARESLPRNERPRVPQLMLMLVFMKVLINELHRVLCPELSSNA